MADTFVFEDYRDGFGRIDQVTPVTSGEEHINPNIGAGFTQPAPYQSGPPTTVTAPRSTAFIGFAVGGAINSPRITSPGVPVVHAGFFCEGYGGQLFDRMHVIETFYDLGVVVDIQIQFFEIWNAFRTTAVTLNSITGVNDTGITLFDNPVGGFGPPPAVFPPRTSSFTFNGTNGGYSFLVTRVGPADIDAQYVFDFTVGPDITMSIVGTRIVVWPHEPENGIREELVYRTTMLTGYDGTEQRIRTRRVPRQSYGVRYFLTDPVEIRKARNRIVGQLGNPFAVPMWQFARPLTSDISSAATIIPVDTTNADFRDTTNDVTSLVVLWRAYDDFETVQIVNGGLAASQLQVELPGTVNAYNAIDTVVIPLQVCVATDEWEWDRNNAHHHLDARAAWLSQDVKDHADLTSLAVHPDDGLPILDDFNIIGTSTFAIEGLNRQIQITESPQGAFQADFGRITPLFNTTKGWETDDAASSWTLREILYGLRGRQKTFHLPTFSPDFIVTDDITGADTSIKVDVVDYDRFVGAQAPWAGIMIEKFDGTRFFRNITGTALQTSPNRELLTLASTLGVAVAAADIRICSFVNLVRLNTDKITIEHDRREVVRVRLPVVGVSS